MKNNKKVMIEISHYGHDNTGMFKEGFMKPSDIIRRRQKKNARKAMLLQRGEELFGSTKFGDAKQHVKLILNNPSLRKLDFFSNLQEQEARKQEILDKQSSEMINEALQTRNFNINPKILSRRLEKAREGRKVLSKEETIELTKPKKFHTHLSKKDTSKKEKQKEDKQQFARLPEEMPDYSKYIEQADSPSISEYRSAIESFPLPREGGGMRGRPAKILPFPEGIAYMPRR